MHLVQSVLIPLLLDLEIVFITPYILSISFISVLTKLNNLIFIECEFRENILQVKRRVTAHTSM